MTNRQMKGVRWMAALGAVALLTGAGSAAAGEAGKQPAGLHGAQAHVDAAGKLRQPSPAEMKALADATRALFARPAQSAQSAQGAQVTEHADGSVSAKLGPESMNVWVATIGPDGQLRQTCVEGVNAANALQAAPALEEK